MKTPAELLDQIIFLYKGYSNEHRATTQPFHLERARNNVDGYVYGVEDLIVREPLIEHSGSLPIVATAIYPYINAPAVNLGDALTMLAIHDIGELIVGDDMTFTKKPETADAEQAHALELLPESLHEAYLDIEERRTESALFAKAIDKITPDIIDVMTPAEVTIKRFRHFVGIGPDEIVPLIKEFKHPYMVWNGFMIDLHLEILDRLDKMLRPYY
ncbi:MAG: HD domain-containing protein [Anaerolineae bacterium]